MRHEGSHCGEAVSSPGLKHSWGRQERMEWIKGQEKGAEPGEEQKSSNESLSAVVRSSSCFQADP